MMSDDLFTSFDLTDGQEDASVTPGAREWTNHCLVRRDAGLCESEHRSRQHAIIKRESHQHHVPQSQAAWGTSDMEEKLKY